MLSNLITSKIKLVKRNGKTTDGISASVQNNKIFIKESVSVEEGDYFEWTNILGVKEKLIVEYVNPLIDNSGKLHHIEINYRKEKIS